jgi:hypothetical protein
MNEPRDAFGSQRMSKRWNCGFHTTCGDCAHAKLYQVYDSTTEGAISSADGATYKLGSTDQMKRSIENNEAYKVRQ